MKCLVRVRKVYRPISGEILGYRLEACVPNKAARRMKKTSKGFAATDEEVPSFRKPYLIQSSSDHHAVSAEYLSKFQSDLKWFGYKEFDLITNLWGGKIEENADAPVSQAVIDEIAKINQRFSEEALF